MPVGPGHSPGRRREPEHCSRRRKAYASHRPNISTVELQSLLSDDDAVSPVIGVVLMVGVTVILSAVVAGFVLSAFDTREPPPQVTFSYDYETESSNGAADGSLTIIVSGGETFAADQVSFSGTDLGTDGGDPNAGSEWHERAVGGAGPDSVIGGGQRAQLEGLSDTFDLEIVYLAPSGGSASVLSTRSGPAP
jgi:FlaG/FlaF family flagellin (archaellin)